MKNQFNRRNFLASAATATLASIAVPSIVSAAVSSSSAKKISLDAGDTILFQGDSITDAGRNKTNNTPNTAAIFGNGYANLAAAELLLKNPGKDFKIWNRGISGNKVFQLADRWDADCLDIKPNVLSILIGVNDFWHKLNGTYQGTIEVYRTDYHKLLDRTLKALPNVKLIIGEPFAVNGVKSVTDKWYPDFDAYRQAARDIAKEYDAAFIPYQEIFDEAQKQAPGSYWTADGVHPTVAGAALMAEAWLKTVK